MSVVQVRALARSFPGLEAPVLRAVDLTVEAGQAVAIVGPSGSGKSTLLALLALLDRPDGGRYELDGRDVTGLADAEATRVRHAAIGVVFQDHHLLPHLTARENVLVPALATSWAASDAQRQRADELLGVLGLADRAHHLPGALSTGQRQRVALARALLLRPRLVLADEPTGALDRRNADDLVGLLRREARDAALIVVTHDPQVAAAMDRTLRLRDGALEPA